MRTSASSRDPGEHRQHEGAGASGDHERLSEPVGHLEPASSDQCGRHSACHAGQARAERPRLATGCSRARAAGRAAARRATSEPGRFEEASHRAAVEVVQVDRGQEQPAAAEGARDPAADVGVVDDQDAAGLEQRPAVLDRGSRGLVVCSMTSQSVTTSKLAGSYGWSKTLPGRMRTPYCCEPHAASQRFGSQPSACQPRCGRRGEKSARRRPDVEETCPGASTSCSIWASEAANVRSRASICDT